jgi:MFS family permease
MFLYLTLYVQNILGYSPLEAGLRFLPITLVSFFVAPVAGRLSARLPVKGFLTVGLLMVGTGLLLMSGLTVRSDWTALLPGFIVAGAGIGMINPPLASTAIGVVPPARSGMASGINNTFRQVGIATGIAALGALFQARVETKVVDLLAATPVAGRSHLIGTLVAGGQPGEAVRALPAPLRGVAAQAAREGFVSGLDEILVVAAAVAFAGAVLAFLLVRGSDFVAPVAGDAAPPSAA